LKPLPSIKPRRARLSLCFALAFLTGIPARAQTRGELPLSAIENRIRAYVKAHEREQIDFLEKAVNISSGTLNLDGVRAVGRAGHLFAERRGKRGRRLLLLGHLDTVFEGEGQRFARLDTLAAGAGTSDMKGGNVVILYALKALHAVGALDDARIIVALMGDEEDPGTPTTVSRKALIDAARRSDIALGFEEDAGKATVARRGIGGWQLVVSARQTHSSGIFSEGSGYGAIYEAARILNEFREKLSKEQYLTFNPGVIVGGTNVTYDSARISGTTAGKDNIIAPRVYARGDLRFLTREQEVKARDAMRAIVARHLPGTTATITFEDGNPAMPPTPGNYKLLAVLDSVSRSLGRGPVEALDPGRRGAGDISFISDYVDALDGLGVIGMRSHTPEEKVDLRSIAPATERAAILIYRLIASSSCSRRPAGCHPATTRVR